jgi:outer membrane lipoprotein
MTKLWLASCVLLCTACVSTPEKLQLPENTTSVDYSQAKSSSSQVIGQKARWGGVIAAVKNNANNTMVEVVNFQLSGSLRPKPGDETQGRFRLYFNGLLDPVIYKEGRSVTAVGTISEVETGKIGDHEYQFPVLKDASVHLWKKVQRVDVNLIQQPSWYYDPLHWSSPYPYMRNNRPIVIRSSGTTPKSKQPTSNTQKR